MKSKRPTGPCVVLHAGRILALNKSPHVLRWPIHAEWFAGTIFANPRRAAHAIKNTKRLAARIHDSLHRDSPQLGAITDCHGMMIVPLTPARSE